MELTTVWFALIAVLWIGYFTLEGFDFGVGMLLPVLAKDDTERRVLINTIGPVWDGNEVWLLVAGGATFAAFPEWYATLVQRLLPAAAADPGRPDRARPRLRVPRQAGRRHLARAAGTSPSSSARCGAGAALGRGLRQHPARGPDRRRPGVRRRVLQPAQPLRPARRRDHAAALPHPRGDVHRPQDRRPDPARRPGARRQARRSARPSSRSRSSAGPSSTPATVGLGASRSPWRRSPCSPASCAACAGPRGLGLPRHVRRDRPRAWPGSSSPCSPT